MSPAMESMAVESSQLFPLDRLPVELQREVVGHLPALDVAALEKASRYWRVLVQDHWAHLRLPYAHRPWGDPVTLKNVACERELMLRSLVRPLAQVGPRLGAALLTRADKLFQKKLYATALVAWSGVDESALSPEARTHFADALLMTQQHKAGMERSIAVVAENPEALHDTAGHMRHVACQPYLRSLLAAWNAAPDTVNRLFMQVLNISGNGAHRDSVFMAELVTHPSITVAQKAAACRMGVQRGNLLLVKRTLSCVAPEEQHALLCEALRAGNLYVAQFLHNRGAPFDGERHPGEALLSAVASGDLACVEWAANLTTTDVRGEQGRTVWHAWVHSFRQIAPENVEAMADILQPHGANVAQPDDDGTIPLKVALELMDLVGESAALPAIVNWLLDHDESTRLDEWGAVGLVRLGDEPLLRKAMAHGLRLAPPPRPSNSWLVAPHNQPVFPYVPGNGRPQHERTMLDFVFCMPGSVGLLHRAGYDLTSWHGRPPLITLLEGHRSLMAAEAWLRAGLDLVAAGCDILDPLTGKTALMHLAGLFHWPLGNQRRSADGEAASRAFTNAMALLENLLHSGADVHAVDEQGKTALHHAVSDEATTLLLRYGADPSALDYEWRPALSGRGGATKMWRPQK